MMMVDATAEIRADAVAQPILDDIK